jgi:rhamnosyltransferase
MPDVTTRDIAAVVVLYRPDASVLDNIAAFAGQVDRVFAVDNTEAPDAAFVRQLAQFDGLEYLPMGGNLGIAAALNAGVERAGATGHAWALTMDQDSTPPAGTIGALLECVATCASDATGIVSARHAGPGEESAPGAGCHRVLTTMTSGNLVSIDAWRHVDGFDETLFVDSVDHDFCLKLDRAGLGVIECDGAVLAHSPGHVTTERFPMEAHPSHHAPIRRYYITRNRFIVGERYRAEHPEFRAAEMRAMRRELAKVVLFENQKMEKLRMSWRGYRDYKRGVTGPFPG